MPHNPDGYYKYEEPAAAMTRAQFSKICDAGRDVIDPGITLIGGNSTYVMRDRDGQYYGYLWHYNITYVGYAELPNSVVDAIYDELGSLPYGDYRRPERLAEIFRENGYAEFAR
jgi:hypothetical protein